MVRMAHWLLSGKCVLGEKPSSSFSRAITPGRMVAWIVVLYFHLLSRPAPRYLWALLSSRWRHWSSPLSKFTDLMDDAIIMPQHEPCCPHWADPSEMLGSR